MAEFSSKEVNPSNSEVYDVLPTDVSKNLADVKIIDVRRPDEFVGELGHIAGSELITLDNLNEEFSKIPKDQTVIIVCRSGGRSLKAAAFLIEQGYSDIYNMKGGMISWNENNFPIEK